MGPGSSETLRKLFLSALNGEEAKPTTAEVIMGRKLKVRFTILLQDVPTIWFLKSSNFLKSHCGQCADSIGRCRLCIFPIS